MSPDMKSLWQERYRGKNILAPMVRIGTLPTRLLALKYGADLVYSEELIDHRLVNCKRIENVENGTIDFLEDDDSRPMFQTCSDEKDKVVVQIGTNDPERALKVAKLLEKDVSGIDVNMGCPKEYSTKGGMGAALLQNPDKIKSILTTLVENLSIPVTCKIRILPKLEDTIMLVKMIETTGVSALAVHGRLKEERPQHHVHTDVIEAISKAVSIPVIANGGSVDFIKSYDDIKRFQEITNTSSVMIARAAEWNLSIFRKEGILPIDEVITEYLKLAIKYNNHFVNVKYIVQELMRNLENDKGMALRASQSLRQICEIWNMENLYDSTLENRNSKQMEKLLAIAQKENEKLQSENIITLPIKFDKSLFHIKTRSPKSILLEYTREKSLKSPAFQTVCRSSDRRFQSTVTVNGRKYKSSLWERNKRLAEQSTAVVCLRSLGHYDGSIQKNS